MSGGEQAAMGQSGFMRPVVELKCREQAISRFDRWPMSVTYFNKNQRPRAKNRIVQPSL